jgi:hypothetical protein
VLVPVLVPPSPDRFVDRRRRAMAAIQSIHLNLQTFDEDGAGTDARIYLGICGREFIVRSRVEDFVPGGSFEYVYGEGATVESPFEAFNDPRVHGLQTEHADRFPVYVRLEPEHDDDNWKLGRAVVTLNGALFPQWDSAALFPFTKGIWLGSYRGLVVHLPKHEDVEGSSGSRR